MTPAACWFIAGWLACALFALLVSRLLRWYRMRHLDAQDTGLFLHACDRLLGPADPADQPAFSPSTLRALRGHWRTQYGRPRSMP